MANSGLNIAQARVGQVCLVTPTGRIDNNTAGQLQTQLSALLAAGEKIILLDLTGVTYLTSAAFRLLLVATNQAGRNAAKFALCGVTGHVRHLFELAGFLDSVTILGSRDEALARLSS
jgi:anti-anti-sigma factor